MRNVVLLMFTSLDGVAEEPSDWFFDDGPELFDLIAEVDRRSSRSGHVRLLG